MGYWDPNENCCQDINVNMVQLVLPAGRYRIRFGATLNSNQYIAIRNKQTDVDFYTYNTSGNISAIIELEQSITVQIRCDGDGQGAMQICNLNVEVYDPNYCATLATGNASGICPVLAEGFVDNGLEPIGWTFDEFRVKDICAPGIQLDLKSGARAIRYLPTIVGATYQVKWYICDGRDGQITLTSSGVDTSFFATTFPISATQTFVAPDTLTDLRILGEAQLAIDSLVVTKVCPRPPPSDRYRYAYNAKESLRSFGGRYDYGFRMYDGGIGRFLTVDPLASTYPFYSPYHYAGNSPILYVDLDGGEPAYRDPQSGKIVPASDHFRHLPPPGAQFLQREVDPEKAAQDMKEFAGYVPFVGTGVAAYDVIDGIREGDWERAGWAAVSLIPASKIVGKGAKLAISKADDIAEIAKGVSKHSDDLGSAAKKVHGNSKASMKPQHGYAIIDKESGKVQEFGVSGQELRPNGTSPRIDQKIREKYKDIPNIEGKVLEKHLPNRAAALDWETGKVAEYKAIFNENRPPRQLRPK